MENNLENLRTEELPDSSQPPSNGRPTWLTFLTETLQTIILAIVLYFLIDSVIARVRVENISMLPTLQNGEYVQQLKCLIFLALKMEFVECNSLIQWLKQDTMTR